MELNRIVASSFCLITALSLRANAQNPPPLPSDSSTGAGMAGRQMSIDSAQASSRSALVLVTSETVDRLRTSQLVTGVAKGESLLLRSASTLTPGPPAAAGWRASPISPQFLAVVN